MVLDGRSKVFIVLLEEARVEGPTIDLNGSITVRLRRVNGLALMTEDDSQTVKRTLRNSDIDLRHWSTHTRESDDN